MRFDSTVYANNNSIIKESIYQQVLFNPNVPGGIDAKI
jgi:hypothetical protein